MDLKEAIELFNREHDKNTQLQAEIKKLKASRVCLWCKKELAGCTVEELTEHLLNCKDHPLAKAILKLEAENKRLLEEKELSQDE